MQSYSNVENQEGDLEDLVTYLLSIDHHLPRSVLLDIETEKMDTSNLFHFLLDLLVSIVRRIYNVELLSIKDYGIDNIDLGKQDKILNYYNSIGFNISFLLFGNLFIFVALVNKQFDNFMLFNFFLNKYLFRNKL